MPVSFYMDVHVPEPVAQQLRRRGVDVLTAIDDGFRRNTDEEVLQRALELNRVVVTQDIGLKKRCEDWQRTGRVFA